MDRYNFLKYEPAMTRIESDVTSVNKSPEEIYNFLSNFNNFQKLMPEQVTNWQSFEEECSVKFAFMSSLGMKIVEKTHHSFFFYILNVIRLCDLVLY